MDLQTSANVGLFSCGSKHHNVTGCDVHNVSSFFIPVRLRVETGVSLNLNAHLVSRKETEHDRNPKMGCFEKELEARHWRQGCEHLCTSGLFWLGRERKTFRLWGLSVEMKARN